MDKSHFAISVLALAAVGLSIVILIRTIRKHSENYRHRRQEDETDDVLASEDDTSIDAEMTPAEPSYLDKAMDWMRENIGTTVGLSLLIAGIAGYMSCSRSPAYSSPSYGAYAQPSVPSYASVPAYGSPYRYAR